MLFKLNQSFKDKSGLFSTFLLTNKQGLVVEDGSYTDRLPGCYPGRITSIILVGLAGPEEQHCSVRSSQG